MPHSVLSLAPLDPKEFQANFDPAFFVLNLLTQILGLRGVNWVHMCLSQSLLCLAQLIWMNDIELMPIIH